MTKVLRYTGLFFVAVVLAAGTSFAAFDTYLRIPDRQGDSRNALHPGAKGWVEILSFSWGVAHRPMVGGLPPGPGRVTVTSSSPQLLRLCAAGTHFKEVVLDNHGRRFVLDNIKVLTITRKFDKRRGPTRLPLESIALEYGRVGR